MPSRRQKERKKKRGYPKYIFRSSAISSARQISLFLSFITGPFSFSTIIRSSVLPFPFVFPRFRTLATVRAVESRFENPWHTHLHFRPTPQPTRGWVSIATSYSRTRRLPLKRVVSPDFEIGRNPETGYSLRRRRSPATECKVFPLFLAKYSWNLELLGPIPENWSLLFFFFFFLSETGTASIGKYRSVVKHSKPRWKFRLQPPPPPLYPPHSLSFLSVISLRERKREISGFGSVVSVRFL